MKIFCFYLFKWVSYFLLVFVILLMPTQVETNTTINSAISDQDISNKQLIGYFTSWSIYHKKHPYDIKRIVESKAAEKLTVINYAFAKVANGVCELGDPWGDYEKPFNVERSVDGVADEARQELKGNFNQLKKLKKLYPNLKVVMAIGGWTWSADFSDAALSEEARAIFVESCLNLFIKGNLPQREEGIAVGIFDGIEIDWEYPAAPGHPSNVYREEDTVNFTALLQEFRRQLDEINPEFILSIAAPAGEKRYGRIELAKINPLLNWINIMTYDYRGAWDKATFHSANLYRSENDPSALPLSTHETVQAYLNAGIPAQKLVVGVPFYGVGWLVADSITDNIVEGAEENNGLYQRAKRAAGHYTYRSLTELLADGHTRYWDDDSKAAWLFDGNTFWTFEDSEVATHKANYVKKHELAGAMVWPLSGDDENASLLKTLHEKLQNSVQKHN